MGKITRTDAEWRAKLTPEQYRILRQGATEPPFSGALLDINGKGQFDCAGCGEPLFSSKEKFDSGTGWPSFRHPMNEGSVSERADHGRGTARAEVRCAGCDSHLGHVFADGPDAEGIRYCINSTSLSFKPEDRA
jgi:peptide-methionine (R)-S-oxide reductase